MGETGPRPRPEPAKPVLIEAQHLNSGEPLAQGEVRVGNDKLKLRGQKEGGREAGEHGSTQSIRARREP